jgi:hypothetical protein
MKKISIFSSALLGALLSCSATANTITANRTLCVPQNHDMNTGPFVTTCSWSRWSRGNDADALITLSGKRSVHAECIYAGTNPIAWVRGMKQADVNVILPGNQFSFNVGYKNDSHYDQNQNIAIYLAGFPPTPDNMLTCTFTAI